MTDMLDKSTLRGLVREVISEVVSDRVKRRKGARVDSESGKVSSQGEEVVEEVSITSDADLADFVKRLLALSKNTEAWLAVEEGQRSFRLKEGGGGQATAAESQEKVERIDSGPVSEARIVALGRVGVTRLILGKTAVLTPLARDRARELKIYVEKETR